MAYCTKHGDYKTPFCPECEKEEADERRHENLIEAEREEAERVIEAQAESQQRIIEAQEDAVERIAAAQSATAAKIAASTRREFAAHLERQRELAEEGWRMQADAKVARGEKMMEAGMVEEAVSLFRAGVAEDPSNFCGHAGLANALFEKGDREGGRKHLQAAIRLLGTEEARSYSDFALALVYLPEDDKEPADEELAEQFFEKFAIRCRVPEQLDAKMLRGFVFAMVPKGFQEEARKFIHAHTTVPPAIDDRAFGRMLVLLHEEGLEPEAEALIRSAGKPSAETGGREITEHLRNLLQDDGAKLVGEYLDRALALSSPVSCPVFWTCLVLFQREIEGRAQLSEQLMQEAASWNLDKQDIWLGAVSGVWNELAEDFPKETLQWLQEALCRLRHQWVAARNARLDQLAHQNVTVAPPGGSASFGIGCGLFIALIFIASSIAVVLSNFGADQRLWMQLTTFGAPIGAIVGTLLIRGFVKSSKERKLIDANCALLQAAEDRKWPESA